jgi:cytochrome P450
MPDSGHFLRCALDVLPAIDPFLAPEQVRVAIEAGIELESYLVAKRRRMLAGGTEPPRVITDLVRVASVRGDRLTTVELMNLCLTLLLVGFDNVTHLIGNAARAPGASGASRPAAREAGTARQPCRRDTPVCGATQYNSR